MRRRAAVAVVLFIGLAAALLLSQQEAVGEPPRAVSAPTPGLEPLHESPIAMDTPPPNVVAVPEAGVVQRVAPVPVEVVLRNATADVIGSRLLLTQLDGGAATSALVDVMAVARADLEPGWWLLSWGSNTVLPFEVTPPGPVHVEVSVPQAIKARLKVVDGVGRGMPNIALVATGLPSNSTLADVIGAFAAERSTHVVRPGELSWLGREALVLGRSNSLGELELRIVEPLDVFAVDGASRSRTAHLEAASPTATLVLEPGAFVRIVPSQELSCGFALVNGETPTMLSDRIRVPVGESLVTVWGERADEVFVGEEPIVLADEHAAEKEFIVRVRSTGPFTGTVTNSRGEPVPGLRVSVHQLETTSPHATRTMVTRRLGRFALTPNACVQCPFFELEAAPPYHFTRSVLARLGDGPMQLEVSDAPFDAGAPQWRTRCPSTKR